MVYLMDKAEIFAILKKICIEAKNISSDALMDKLDEYVYEQRNLAKQEQEQKDIIATIVALCDAGITDENKLRDLLYEHFHIDSRNETDYYIKMAKTVSFPAKKLITHLRREGYNHSSIKTFIEKNHVYEKLENNSRLSDMSVTELKNYLETQ